MPTWWTFAKRMDPIQFPGTIEDDEDIQVDESDSDEEEVSPQPLFCLVFAAYNISFGQSGMNFACRSLSIL